MARWKRLARRNAPLWRRSSARRSRRSASTARPSLQGPGRPARRPPMRTSRASLRKWAIARIAGAGGTTAIRWPTKRSRRGRALQLLTHPIWWTRGRRRGAGADARRLPRGPRRRSGGRAVAQLRTLPRRPGARRHWTRWRGVGVSNEPLRFALIGAAGYVAPRHLRAIKDTGNRLVAALDPHDNVGVMDSYFPDAEVLHRVRAVRPGDRQGAPAGAASTTIHLFAQSFPRRPYPARAASPAPCHLREAAGTEPLERRRLPRSRPRPKIESTPSSNCGFTRPIRFANRSEAASSAEPLRRPDLHHLARALVSRLMEGRSERKSGGISTNIGIHFFDMLCFVFGRPAMLRSTAHTSTLGRASSSQSARVRWLLSIDMRDLPEPAREAGKTTYRSIRISKTRNSNFPTALRTCTRRATTKSYPATASASKTHARRSNSLSRIRDGKPVGLRGDYHPALRPAWSRAEMRRHEVHPTAIVDEGATIGEGTSIWHWTHVSAGP